MEAYNMQKITPHLWFDNEAEEAVGFYTSLFRESRVGTISRYTETGTDIHGQEEGSVMTVEFEVEGQKFIALNGGPVFSFTPAISFIVNSPTKEEVDELWEKLSAGGTALMPLGSYPFSERYGWIQDKYGVSWQLLYADYISERKIVPSLMFVGEQCGKAEQAINLYASAFNHSEVGELFRYGPNQEPDKEGTLMFADFALEGQKFAAMDSAHDHKFTFTEAISFLVNCESQEEVDDLWDKLAADPDGGQCGWTKDRFGVSWQIVPIQLGELISDPDPEKAARAMEAMFKMKKLDIAALRAAHEGNGVS